MPNFRTALSDYSATLTNYAYHPVAPVDLSLVTGPNIWDLDFHSVIDSMTLNNFANYPNPPEDQELIELISKFEDVPHESIMLCPGADVGIEIIFRQFLEPKRNAAVVIPTFPRFEIVLSTLSGISVNTFSSLAAIDNFHDMICLCSPNNPSTKELDKDILIDKIKAFPNSIFFIDAVFDHYGTIDFNQIAMQYDNVIVLKSFSKIGMAGIRLGYIISNAPSIDYLRIGQSPFLATAFSQMVGKLLLQEISQLDKLKPTLADCFNDIHTKIGEHMVRDSEVPFYLLKIKINSEEAETILSQQGISVVGGHKFKGLGNRCLRIAIGTKKQNAILIKSLKDNKLI